MLDLKSVLPNFIYTSILVAATVSFSAFAAEYAQYEETTDATVVEEAAEITDAAEGTMTEAKEYGTEATETYQDITESAEELEGQAEVIESE